MSNEKTPMVVLQADVGEVKEALNSSQKIMEAIALNVQSFMPKV